MKDLVKKIAELGLSDNEAKVYLAALELGPAGVSDISNKARIKRTSVYKILEDLKRKKLVSYEKTKTKTMVHASGPVVLELLISEQNQRLSELLPDLKSLISNRSSKPKITFQNSEEEIKKTFLSLPALSDENYAYGIYSSNIKDFVGSGFIKATAQARVKNKIGGKLIVINAPEDLYSKISKEDSDVMRDSKLVRSEREFPANIDIYGNNVLISKFEGSPTSVLIEDEKISESFKALFELLWEKS